MNAPAEITDICDQALALVKAQVSEGVWQSTFAKVTPVSGTDNTLVLSAPHSIVREKLEGKFRPLVEEAVFDATGKHMTVEFEVVANPTLFPLVDIDNEQIDLTTDGSLGVDDLEVEYPESSAPTEDGTAPAPETRPGLDFSDRYTFDSFVIGGSNRFAHAAALAVAEKPGDAYNPLFIYGDAGLGKTHLLKAVEHYVNDVYPNHKVKYVSTETFLNEFVDSIRQNQPNEFKRRYRQIDVLLIDDIQFIAGREGLQEELFHTFNDLYSTGKQIVLSSDRPPDAIPGLEDRLRSRFMMGLLTDIQPPDIDTRMAILSKKADRDGYFLPTEVSEFIASNITSNIRELEGALNKVTAYANLNSQAMTRDLAERLLRDFIDDRKPRPITIAMILEATSEQFGFPIPDLTGKSRRRPLVIARQVAMYVARELTDHSYPAIAREFGGRDHTTVMHACDKIGALMKERTVIYDQVTELDKSVRRTAQVGE